MKKHTNSIRANWKQVFVVSITCLMICSVAVQSNQVTIERNVKRTYSFNSPILETVDIEGTIYDRVTLDDCYSAGSAGEPKIPSKGIFLLLPPDSQVSDIEITTGEMVILGSGFNVEPTSQAIPISQTDNIPIPVPNQVIYQSNIAYPGTLFTQVGVQFFRGYQILVLLLHPVQYNPVTGELFYYTSLEVSVQTITSGVQSALYRGLHQDITAVEQKVDNPEMTQAYNQHYTSPPASFENYNLLIITTDALKTGFEPLKQAHDATGVATVIKTLTDIGGSDLESIRELYPRCLYQLGGRICPHWWR